MSDAEAKVVRLARAWAHALERVGQLEPEDSYDLAGKVMFAADQAHRDLLAAINRLPAETVTADPLQEALL